MRKIFPTSQRPSCPTTTCLAPRSVIKQGFFRLHSGARRQRFLCRACRKFFSQTTATPAHRLRKIHLTQPLMRLRCRNLSIRDTARELRVSQGFVLRRVSRLGELSRIHNARLRRKYVSKSGLLTEVQIDEMETYEHTRLKPLSISLSVTPERFIIRAEVATIPAKGRLAATSRAKYGARADGSGQALERVLGTVARMSGHRLRVVTDKKTSYGPAIRRRIPGATHEAVKSRAGAVAGTGEAKEKAFDRMFALNHTCAVVRSQMSRLNRRTWKGSKKAAALQDELDLFVWWHNMGIMGLR